jgi:molybdopterin molybdotransferase
VSGLLPVEDALARVLDGVDPVEAETVPLAEAAGRILAGPLAANRTQPPADLSAMDGYAVRAADIAEAGAALARIGEAPAGHAFAGRVGPGQTVRIFTGAAVPDGADAVLLQEDAVLGEDGRITATEAVRAGQHIRRRGLDFARGEIGLPAGTRLGMRQLSLAAAMNHAELSVRRKPRVAIIATGDELSLPGPDLHEDRIVASTGYGLAALIGELGGVALDFGIVPDDRDRLATTVDAVIASRCDVLVTLGGASVGDHDFAQEVLKARGMSLGFWKIAMRPGKPLIFGRLGPMRVLGLPGNPVSSLVCALLFLKPLVQSLLGLPVDTTPETAELGAGMKANDHRQDYIRAALLTLPDGKRIATALPRQDSSMLSTFAEANCLIIRVPNAPAAKSGEITGILRLP